MTAHSLSLMTVTILLFRCKLISRFSATGATLSVLSADGAAESTMSKKSATSTSESCSTPLITAHDRGNNGNHQQEGQRVNTV